MINFSENKLILHGSMPSVLHIAEGGHCELNRKPVSIASTQHAVSSIPIYPASTENYTNMEENTLLEPNGATNIASDEQLLKLHRHIGHADIPTVLRIVKHAGFPNTRLSIDQALAKCNCEKKGNPPQNPICSKIPSSISRTVCLVISVIRWVIKSNLQ